ncbi:hypothetical protein LRS10_18550 [Phenylobacterium sp. J426]|uniref:hypothetical protein n=1 Tax=Phenylobacterium sp. J426 TaxID=2898439 RepID=UPI0021518262|nr:hypothetical protein [Phenylobacterium sp. J426]MCR5875971.1 hypothetical protein [Phenylobacterium sp. J426]
MLLPLLAAALAAASPPTDVRTVDGANPQDAFFARLTALCGRSFQGRLASDDPADAAFRAPATLQVRDCTADTVRMPLQVGQDRSRTWVVTRTAQGLTLKHDHRHADGSEDVLSQYGGSTAQPGSAERQDFPADAFSRALFERQSIPASMANVWSLQLRPGQLLAYELNRPGRRFRLEFDLSRPD